MRPAETPFSTPWNHPIGESTALPCARRVDECRIATRNKGSEPVDVPDDPDALVTLAQLADLEVIAATIPVGIFRTEFERGIVYVNDRLLDIVGMSRDEVLGEGWVKAVHPDDRERVAAQRAEVRSGTGEIHIEYRILRTDGIVRWIAVRASPFFDDDGTPAGLVGAVGDITDRVLAEEDAARLSAVCEQTTDFVVVSDVDGRILYSNAAAQRALADRSVCRRARARSAVRGLESATTRRAVGCGVGARHRAR